MNHLCCYSESQLEAELERRKVVKLKEEYEKLSALSKFIQENKEVLKQFAMLVDNNPRTLNAIEDSDYMLFEVTLYMNEVDLDKYKFCSKGKAGHLLWEANFNGTQD